MNNYEVMYIVKPVEEEAYSAVVKKFDDLLTANGATIEKTDKVGAKAPGLSHPGHPRWLVCIDHFQC